MFRLALLSIHDESDLFSIICGDRKKTSARQSFAIALPIVPVKDRSVEALCQLVSGSRGNLLQPGLLSD